MDKPMTFNEWMGTLGNNALVHANCCRKAYEAGQQSQQAKVEELQAVALRGKQATYAAGFHDGRHGTPCEYLKLQAERDELQKRVDFLEKHLKPCECGSKEICVDQEGYITKHCYRCGGIKSQEMIEQALKGECKHESDGSHLLSIPPKTKCKKCGEFYSVDALKGENK